jgi:hypothetical protein
MFLCYTHLGVGHLAMLWKITRDCSESVVQINAMDIANSSNDEDVDNEVAGDDEGYDECNHEDSDQEYDDDLELSDGELHDGAGDNDSEGYEDANFNDKFEDVDISF